MERIQINTYTKNLGFGWTRAGKDGLAEVPTHPQITGTIGQIRRLKKSHPGYLADQECERCERWFYDGREITKVGTGLYARLSSLPSDIDRLVRSLDKDGVFISLKPES